MPRLKKSYTKIIAAKPYEDMKSSNTNYVHEFRGKTVVIYNFFSIGYLIVL